MSSAGGGRANLLVNQYHHIASPWPVAPGMGRQFSAVKVHTIGSRAPLLARESRTVEGLEGMIQLDLLAHFNTYGQDARYSVPA